MSPPAIPLANSLRSLHRSPADHALALVFPGQGSQLVGMAAAACRSSRDAAAVFTAAEEILALPLRRLCFEGPEGELRQTANAQPAIMAASLASLAAALESGALDKRPAFVAGHSLGEYTALVAAGALTIEDGLRIVTRRGSLMEDAGRVRPGDMAALLGLSEEQVDDLCREAGVEPCNYNSPAQTVVGGAPGAVELACRLAHQRGGKGLPLNVSGAFHTSLMADAADAFAAVVDSLPLADALIPLVANSSAAAIETAEDIRLELKEQMLRPVLWRQSLAAMAAAGVRTIVEVGPGRVLSALVKRTVPGVRAVSMDGAAAPSLSNV